MSDKANDANKPVTALAPEAAKIWAEIQNRNIEMFALPNQTVAQHCSPVPLGDPNKLYLVTRSTSVLPSLETACGSDFTVELADKFVIVARAPTPLTIPKK